MFAERVLGKDGSHQSRLGALSALLCGMCSPLAVVLLVLEPSVSNAVALVVSAAVAAAGAMCAARGSRRPLV